MYLSIIIVIFALLVIFVHSYVKPIIWKQNLDNFIEAQTLFIKLIDEYILRYTNTQAVHDVLVGDTAISVLEYNNIVMDGCKFVLSYIPKYLKKLLFLYYTKTEIQDIIISSVTLKIDEVYTISFLEPIEEFESEIKRRSNV